jgi:DMSO/TMAO reductase YedYZ heme-binding membrane subunit
VTNEAGHTPTATNNFAGSHLKRRTVACVFVGIFALTPLFLVSRPIIQLDTNTLNQVEPDIGGTGSMLLLLATLSITPLVTVTRSYWFVPLRRWFGIMVAITATTDAIVGGLTSSFAGGFIGHLTGHTFLLAGLCMVMIMAPLALTSNNRAQRAPGKYWKPLQRLTYVVWALLWVHLALLEGFGFQNGTNGPSAHLDGDPIAHQRLYQLTACSIPLVLLRMPPARRWVARKQEEGKQRVVSHGPATGGAVHCRLLLHHQRADVQGNQRLQGAARQRMTATHSHRLGRRPGNRLQPSFITRREFVPVTSRGRPPCEPGSTANRTCPSVAAPVSQATGMA